MRKHLDYLKYVLRHKWFVAIQCFRHGLFLRAITHDLSKFRPSEWFPYVDYFYGSGKYPEKFDMAWLKHQHRNRHHWQWWILRQDDGGLFFFPMSKKDRLEMVCDWWGAGRAQGRGGWEHTWQWYEDNKEKIQLHPETREWVEWFLKGKML